MTDNDEDSPPPPLSEVGSVLVQTQNENAESNRWRAMFEQQNAHMRALIEALQAPKVNNHVDLPEFDPDKMDTDARSWCATADLCFAENPLSGGQLVVVISKALKGAASTWLSQIAYQGMTWAEFKVLFTTRFISTETLAGTLIHLNNDKPSDKETIVAYASRLITSLSNRWKEVDKEQIVVAMVLAHISQFDTRLQRLAFTSDITSRDRLQQELHAFSHLKRKINTPSESSSTSDAKRTRITSLKCYTCGKMGHKRSECRSKSIDIRGRPATSTTASQAAQQPAGKPFVCFKCGKPGHIAIRCTSGGSQVDGAGGASTARSERRVDVCVVQPPSCTLEHKGRVTGVSRCDMRALCSVRGPLGGDTRALGAGARLLSLRMPGQPQPIHFVVEAKARVKELKSLASAHAQLQGMTDTDLFGLAILQNGEYLFVDSESKLSKYAPKSWRSSHTHGLDANGKPLLELHLVVQFHVESPLLLHDEIGRHLYFLQLRHNVRSRDALPAEVLLLLTGLALQAEYGDADSYEDRDYFKVEEYAPPSLTGDWVSAAMRACHREHRGLSKSDAETRFIREVCLLPDTVNSHRYRFKQSKSEPEPGTVWLLVTAKGIKILPDNGTLSNFIWSAIGKLSFDRKKFEIRTEEGKITLYSSSEEKCKYLFALCKETHQFSMKIAPKFNEVIRKEEEERKICFGYSKSFNLQYNQNKSEQRISVISTTSSNTTSGIVSDRVQSEDELEIMIDSPPAPSTESLAFAHLLDSSNSYFIRHIPQDKLPLVKSASMQLHKGKNRVKRSKEESDNAAAKDIPSPEGQNSTSQLEETNSLPDQSITEILSDSPTSSKLKCTGSQCSSSCSTVIMARAGLSTLSRTSNASSLELGYSHTAQNSMLSDNSTVGIDVEYTQDTASALYDGLGQPVTVAASSETSGVYTMASSELTGRSKMDALSEADSRTDYDGSHYDSYKPSKENDLADFDSVSSILKNKSDRTNQAAVLRLQAPLPSSDCVDGASNFASDQQNDKELLFRDRTNSNASAASFHGDGSDPTDNKHNLLTASELSDLIVGRGVYPKSQSVSDTLDSVSDYVRLLLPFSGDSYIQGHEDTAPSDDNYPNNSFFDRPPTPPTRTDSRKPLHLSLPNLLDMEAEAKAVTQPPFPNKPPPPYEYNHRTVPSYVPTVTKEPPAYPGTSASTLSLKQPNEKEEVAARVVTSKPMITILKAEAGDVNASSERTFASPMVLEHRFQKSKRHQASSRRAERSKLAQGINHNLSPSREIPPHGVDANVLVAMMKLPPPPPPPRRTRLPPPPPVTRLPPPPPPHNQIFHQQLYSDVDYVYYPLQDPAISQQNYLDHKLTETRMSNIHKSSMQYRSTPYLSTSLSASSMYGSIQNLSDSYVQLPGTRASWYSLTSRTSISNHSINHERPPMPTRIPDMSYFSRTKSDENILNVKDPPPIKMRRMPPPPPPPYEHKKKLPTHLRVFKSPPSASNIISEVSASRAKDSNCDLDIKTLREKSKNLDLPLIAALCNDRSLLKQTKAFGAPKLSRQTGSDCESDHKSGKYVPNTTENVDVKNRQECDARKVMTGSQKKILIRNPTDKLPALPVSEPHTPRAMSNTYVMHPSVIKTKKTQPSS